MPILYAELQIAGRQVACQVASFSFEQPADDKGRPSATVRIGLLKAVVVGEAAGWSIWEEIKFNPYRRESGHLVFFKNVGQTARRYTFYDAALVWLQFRYDGKGTAGKQTATQVELHFSAATIELDGIRLDAHSVIPWATDPQTSFRALTKPPAPLPSAHLAAGMGVVAGRRLAEAAAAVVKKALPIAGEGLARTLTLLPSLLLTSVNADADPAKDRDWQMYMRNHAHPAIPPPPPPDKVRLAQLERALAAHTLTAPEEAELIILLAKVKGIHVQRLTDLSPAHHAAVKPPTLDPANKPLYAPTISKWLRKGGDIAVLPNGNWRYTDWLGNSVEYEGDEPNFDKYSRQQVDVDNMTGDCTSDFDKADEKAPLGPKLTNNTWHHKQNMKTMQEVDRDIHRRFTHYGGRYMVKQTNAGSTVKKTPLIKRGRP